MDLADTAINAPATQEIRNLGTPTPWIHNRARVTSGRKVRICSASTGSHDDGQLESIGCSGLVTGQGHLLCYVVLRQRPTRNTPTSFHLETQD